MNKTLLLFSFFTLFNLFGCSNVDSSKLEKKEDPPPAVQTAVTVEEAPNQFRMDTVSTDYIMGKFTPKKNKKFVLVKRTHTPREGMYLREETYGAFQEMFEAAKEDGIKLTILSATRNFHSQKRIWEGKWTGKRKVEDGQDVSKTIPDPRKRALKILEYSSMPGTSRHHWGTDIDINAFNNEYFEQGRGKAEYDWLVANAAKFGFCQPYTKKNAERPDGYNEEKWHWSFLPLSKPLIDEAKKRLKNEMIEGFMGAETAPQINVVEKYILGINKECL